MSQYSMDGLKPVRVGNVLLVQSYPHVQIGDSRFHRNVAGSIGRSVSLV